MTFWDTRSIEIRSRRDNNEKGADVRLSNGREEISKRASVTYELQGGSKVVIPPPGPKTQS